MLPSKIHGGCFLAIELDQIVMTSTRFIFGPGITFLYPLVTSAQLCNWATQAPIRSGLQLHWLQSGERVVFQPFSSFTAGCGDYLSAVLHLKIQKPPPQHIHKLSHPHPPIIVKTLFFSFFYTFSSKSFN